MQPRIAIIGGGFAGLAAAQELKGDCAVTVIDPTPWFEWLPNIHELVSGVKRAADLRLPRRRIVAAAGHTFVRARVKTLEPRAGRIALDSGRVLPFDVAIVAVGGVHDTFGVPGAERYALPFKSVDQCDLIGRRLRALARGRNPVSVVIVGGGLEGVEALGEILRAYRRRSGLSCTVVEASTRLLSGAPAGLDATVRADCADLPVRFVMQTRVAQVRRKSLRLASGEDLRFDLCLWTGGAAAPPFLAEAGLAPQPRRWAPVHATLQSTRYDNVFVAGDAASLTDGLSKQAFFALQMGKQAAVNAARLLRGQRLRDFAPSPKPMLVTFGDLDTFLVQDGIVLAGTALAAAKEAVFQLTMTQLDPPTGAAAIASLHQRLTGGLASILPALTSPERLLRLPRLRLV